MNLSRFATTHTKAIIFVTVVLCIIGAAMIPSFPVSILPDVTFPRVVVIAETAERPARIMEISVARPLEEAIATVPGVRRVRSQSQRGATEVNIDFAWGTDVLLAQQAVNTKVNEVRSQLPSDADITVERMNPTVFPIMGLSLSSPGLSQAELWGLATYKLRPRLARIQGVARVVVQGGRVPEVAVEADPRKLAAYRITLQDVQQAISQSNIVRAVGRFDRQFLQYQAVVSGETIDMAQLAGIAVTQKNGVPVSLRQVATIRPSVQDPTTVVTADGIEAVLLNVVRQPDANTITTVQAVQQEVEAIQHTLPPGAKIGIFYDQSLLVNEAVGSVRDAVIIGAVLAVIVLLMFLGDLRATAVTAVIVPATVLISFLLMRLAGLSLNLMTLGALAVGIGLVIDDAIVVVENVFRHMRHGEGRADAVRTATGEIAAPMISSTLTTVVVFLPLILTAGVVGAFFTALALTLTIALMVSLVLALLVSPTLCAAFLRSRPDAPEHGRLFERVLRMYGRVLVFTIRHRWIAPAAAVVIIGLTVFLGLRLGIGFMPTMDEGAFVLDFWTPPGTSLPESDRILRQVEDILKETPEVTHFSRRTGTELGFSITEPNRGDFAIMLKAGRRRNIEKVMDEVRGKIESGIPGLKVEFVQVLQDLIGDLAGDPAAVEVKLFGENSADLQALAKDVAGKLEKVDGAVDVKSGIIEEGPELVARVDPIRAGRTGMTASAVADQAEAGFLGTLATKIVSGDRLIGVRVRYPAAFRTDKAAYEMLPIRPPGGFIVPLSSLATVASVPGASQVNREDQRRLISVTAGLEGPRDLGSVVKDVQKVMRATPLPPGVTYQLGGQIQSQAGSFRSLMMVLALAILLVFAVMLFQFGAFTEPLVILIMMPLALFGVALGLWVTKTPLNVSSFMGAIMLVGIVVKNGILLLDQAQKSRIAGSEVEEAVIEAGRHRLRPILMTTLTALLGLAPLALGIGAGAEMQQPLAIAVIGGLAFSTICTLVFAPAIYVIACRMHRSRNISVPDQSIG